MEWAPGNFQLCAGTQFTEQSVRVAQNRLGHKRIDATAQNHVFASVRLGATDGLV